MLYSGVTIDTTNVGTSLYVLVYDAGTKDPVQLCETACNADSQCGAFDYVNDGGYVCQFYTSDATEFVTSTGYNTYVKSNTYTING